jgi:hypothetical protein
MHGDGLVLGLTEMASAVEIYKPTVNQSCGYHVHVDARDYSWFDVATVFKVWVDFGRDIAYKYLWPTRASNRFCFSFDNHRYRHAMENLMNFKTTKEAKQLLMLHMWGVQPPSEAALRYDPDIGATFGRKMRAVARDKYGTWRIDQFSIEQQDARGRYADFNVHSWRYRGTLEFRAHPGTTNTDDLIMWPITCLSLVEDAHKISKKGW